MFTADPLSENRNIISIDASYGLGEAVVWVNDATKLIKNGDKIRVDGNKGYIASFVFIC